MSALRTFVFLGAFLLFSMEPMVGRLLLPSFGGAFHVWTTSLMFFQGALFLGYLYAHLAARRVGRAHLALLLVPMVLLPPAVRLGASEGGGVLALLAELVVDFGLPFIALATTGVVAQQWLARSSLPERTSPYFLYSTSNAGSLLALLAYALVIEPLVGLSAQRWAWALGYVAYLGAAFVAYRASHRGVPAIEPAAAPQTAAEPEETIGAGRIAYWLVLSAFPSIFLMAVTNLIALDAGNVPLVWVVPLALYLMTFVLAFASPSRVPDWIRRLWPVFGSVGLFFFAGADTGGTWLQAILHLFVLFAICLAAHGELYANRPTTRHLTLYYLVLSLGGWLGGAFVALGAPALFSGLWEYPIAIVGLVLTVAIARRRDLLAWARGPGKIGIALILVLIAAMGWRIASATGGARASAVRKIEVRRSFYGIYYVLDRPSSRGTERDLISGSTRHGRQFLAPEHRREPLSYYHREGPLGDAMEILRARDAASRRFGVVGLGVGAAAAYVEPGESIDFFEIDQAVDELAREHFFYLADCRGREQTIIGDARLTLARQLETDPEQRYDLLLIDAFAGDAIPTHLVTREAVELYRGLVAEHGVLLFHISNRYYDLRPVLATIARELGLHAALRDALRPADREAADPSVYFVMLEREEALAPFLERGFEPVTSTFPSPGPLWTDDHVNTIAALLPDWE
ncbi:MAG: fused MFS/spermidine synthase [Myxococcota bacterium]|nr:fused MFS/spermidine synthase [Myxococcota bacterium]